MARIASPLPLRLRSVDIAVRFLLPLIGVALLSAGLVGVVSFALFPLVDALSSRDWIAVPARVERVEIHPVTLFVPLPFDRIEVRYVYSHDGRAFESSRFGPHQDIEGRRRSAAFVERVRQDRDVTVWVDGNAPHRATLHRKINWVVFALTIPSLIFTFLGAVLVLASMMLWSDRRSLFRRRTGTRSFTESD